MAWPTVYRILRSIAHPTSCPSWRSLRVQSACQNPAEVCGARRGLQRELHKTKQSRLILTPMIHQSGIVRREVLRITATAGAEVECGTRQRRIPTVGPYLWLSGYPRTHGRTHPIGRPIGAIGPAPSGLCRIPPHVALLELRGGRVLFHTAWGQPTPHVGSPYIEPRKRRFVYPVAGNRGVRGS